VDKDFLRDAAEEEPLDGLEPACADHDHLCVVPRGRVENDKGRIAMETFGIDRIGSVAKRGGECRTKSSPTALAASMVLP